MTLSEYAAVGIVTLWILSRAVPATVRLILVHRQGRRDAELAVARSSLEQERRLRAGVSQVYTNHMHACPMIAPLSEVIGQHDFTEEVHHEQS